MPGQTEARRLPNATIAVMVMLVLGLSAATPAESAARSVKELRGLTIDELADIQVTSVFKRPEPISKTPASVYVITAEEIRRSGALTIPEALRLAPNLMVARRSSREYAITARGLNMFQLSNKLLVMIDGRSIYTPLHAGVLWDENLPIMEDIKQIEVISGPGGTIWGANAVNGVINIITRNAHDTQGGLAAGTYGTTDRRAALRYGDKFGEDAAWRAYGQHLEMGETLTPGGNGRDDDWSGRQAGFRTDWSAGVNDFTVQGDLMESTYAGQNDSGNVLARWTHRLGGEDSLTVQTYYSEVIRSVTATRDEEETFDIEARHNLRREDHEIVWGGSYRHVRNLFDNDLNAFVLNPEEDTFQIASVFAQDTYAIMPDLSLTYGAKYEHHSLSGGELMPSVRLAWMASPHHMLWGAVSRAVRTPSRIDRDLQAPGVLLDANDDFDSEELIAYEMGYRGQPSEKTSLSISLYYHDYDNLRVLTNQPGGVFRFGNAQHGYTTGIESWGEYQASNRWRVMAGVNLFRKNLDLEPGASTAALYQHQGADPDYQVFLRSYFDVTNDVDFDVFLRRVDELPSISVGGYTALDARLAWQIATGLELEMVGTNLLDDQHPEHGLSNERGEIPRSVYVGAQWRF